MRKKASPTLLSMARESRGLTQGELAHLVGISQGKISKFEHGMLEVSEGDLADLSRVLDYPQSFFFQDDDSPAAGSGCMYYRKRQSMPVGELRTIHARLRIRCRHIARLLRSAEIDAENKFPRMDVDDYDGGPEEIARLIRANWKLPMGPVANLIIAIENAGGVVIRCSFGTKKLDAISQWASGFPPMFFVNDSISTDRLRWSLAHEIGHIVMHRVPNDSQEHEADRFAAELLAPAREIASYLRPMTIQKLAALKPFWKISMAALLKRAFDLDKISESYYRKLFTAMSKLGYRTAEPLPLPREEPEILDELIRVHLDEHGYSIHELSGAVLLYEHEFRSLYLRSNKRLRVI